MVPLSRQRTRYPRHAGAQGRRALWAWIAAGATALACSSCSSPDGTALPPPRRDAGLHDASSEQDGVSGGDAADGEAGTAACTPKTCAQLGAVCGSAPDGCGGKVECGKCPLGQLCGGGGANKCGTNPCQPKTCAQVSASCGYASDLCSTAIDCGGCTPPLTCGATGKLNECGCKPKTCAQLGASCGTAPDGCGQVVDCGTCAAGQTCGGGGPNKCGTGTCNSKTCTQLGASCGFASDGCAKALDCGKCTVPQTCGGAGTQNQCGCSAKTCSQVQASCGNVDTGCGQMNCGTCAPGDDCGGAGTPNQCGCVCTLPHAVTSCSAGACSVAACSAGWGDCDSEAANGCEAELGSVLENCGQCGKLCSIANGIGACVNGTCSVGSCHAGYADCNASASDGCETNLNSDPNHCTQCGKACPSGTGTPVCELGVCKVSNCNAGLGDCDADPTNGCETNITSTAAHCGACGNACSLTNAKPACTQSSCTVGSCNTGWGNCDANDSNGCETKTSVSLLHCGTCNHACPTPPFANPTCSAGQCGFNCKPGYSDCDKSAATGCEVHTDSDVTQCGACGAACVLAHADPMCLGGSCMIAGCQAGWGNCDGASLNGCEVNLGSDPSNCGACGVGCQVPHANVACSNGCQLVSCVGTFQNCDGVDANGCEVDLSSSVSNCGTCGKQCSSNHGTPSCAAGVCKITCAAGYADCNNNPADGCEVNINTVSNCGGCGQACSGANGTPSCSGGNCSISCNAGFGNCDGNARLNGCEVSHAADTSHCGSCGNNCNSPQPANTSGNPCSSGTCLANCNAGFFNTDSTFANGCECQADTISDSCASAVSLGTIPLGGSGAGSGNITPVTDVDYWVVTFSGQANSCAFHPVITLSDPSGQLRMDVTTDCTKAANCSSEGGTSLGVTQFEMRYSPGCGSLGNPDPWRYPMPVGTFYIRVYRAVSTTPSCMDYSISVSN